MPRRIVDLSVSLRADVASDPPMALPKITYLDHKQTAAQMASFFPGLTEKDLPGGDGWALEQLEISTHVGTHLDAPWHFHSTTDGGERAWTIDEMPLDWCYQRGVKLDFRHFPDGYVVGARDVEAELDGSASRFSPSTSSWSTPARASATASRTTSRRAAAWGGRRRSTSPSAG